MSYQFGQYRAACRALAGAGAAIALMITQLAHSAPPPAEQKLIEQLIHDVRGMHDVVFIRNGSEYDSKEAAEHLSEKYAYFKDRIETADDFIRLCATRSEMSGRAYRVRDGHGVETESAQFLRAHLAALRAAQSAPPASAAPAAPSGSSAASPTAGGPSAANGNRSTSGAPGATSH